MIASFMVAVLAAAFSVPDHMSTLIRQEKRFISVRNSNGGLRGGFEARPQPYRSGARLPLRLALRAQPHGKTSDGRVVNGVGLYGWAEGENTRVKVFVLIPAPGVENAFVWLGADGDEKLVAREFSEIVLGKDGSKPIVDMKQLGLEPLRVEVGPSMPLK